MIRDGKIMPILTMDYPVKPPQRQKIIGWFGGDENPLTTTKPNVAKEEHKAIKKFLLEENPSFPLERDLLLNARDYTRQGRYGLAVFELGTALEVAVNNLLLSKGMDENELRYRCHFEDKYDSMLHKHTGVSLKDARSTLFSDVRKIWNIRNNVAHKRLAAYTDKKGEISERIESKENVEPLIRSTEQTLDFLNAL
jgi:HEPN domain-containing protein